MKKLILLFIIFFTSCHKPDVTYDYELAAGRILGKTNCIFSDNKEYWIVNFEPSSVSAKIYGVEIIMDQKVFKNSVLTNFDLSEQFKDSVNLYLFSFYPKTDSISCYLNSGSIFNIPKADVIESIPAFY